MSCDYFIFCVTCGSRHDFDNSNHQAPLMHQLIGYRRTFAAMDAVITDIAELTLHTNCGRIDTRWFAQHVEHELRVIDEYGKLDGNCARRVAL